MKRLVKTAKQQFEERLNELTLVKEFQSTPTDVYFLCENEHCEMSILRKIHNEEFFEYKYEGSYRELIESELFLDEITGRFVEVDMSIKPLFDWYASADKDNEPFTLDDIWMCNLELKDYSVVFEDLYEEVPDVRVITAKEQWENDSKDAKLCCKIDNGTIWKVLVEKDRLAFFRSNDEDGFYHRYDLPSMDNLRKDATFIAEYLSLIQDMHPEDLDSAVTWIKKGVYTMSDCSMMDIYQSSKTQGSYEYEDKEIEPIINHDFSNDITALSNIMVDHIVKLHKGGMSLCSELLLNHIGHIVTKDGFIYDTEDIRICYFRVDNDGIYQFSTEYNYDSEGDSDDFLLGELSIETLHQIIEAMK